MKNERNFTLFNIVINKTIHVKYDQSYQTKIHSNLSIAVNGYSVRTSFDNSKQLLRQQRSQELNGISTLNQASQVHEFVIQYLLTHHSNLKGLNFVVTDPLRIIVEVQVQLRWWERILLMWMWKKRCFELSRLISSKMPIGFCNIKPI